MKVDDMGFELIRDLLLADPYFGLILASLARDEDSHYALLDGYLFLGDCLCIPYFSLRHVLVKEVHNCGHFGRDKILTSLCKFFWLSIDCDVSLYVKHCHVCQTGKRCY